MAEYCTPFEDSFVCRTNSFIHKYHETLNEYEATIILNCLLGMLMLPVEVYSDRLDEENFAAEIVDFFEKLRKSNRYDSYGNEYTGAAIIRHLRNSIAHFQVTPVSANKRVTAFEFSGFQPEKYCPKAKGYCKYKNDFRGNPPCVFYAQITIAELKQLAELIKHCVLSLENKPACKNCDYWRRKNA